MEELEAALKGNKNGSALQHASSFDISADSLETLSNRKCCKTEGKDERETERNHAHMTSISQSSSYASIKSEPVFSKSQMKHDFVNAAMSDYLNSHRHSLSSVMELMSAGAFVDGNSDNNHSDSIYDEEKHEDLIEPDYVCEPFFILSPIEEKSEPSTRSSSFKDSSGSDRRRYEPSNYSKSCNEIQTARVEMPEKYQTFPRAKSAMLDEDVTFCNNLYPLEPRELDPSAFYQLHTADSQEELQEFLLLESECMSDITRGAGIASAFISSNDDQYYPEGKLT